MSVLELFGVDLTKSPDHKVYQHQLTPDPLAKTPHVWDLLGTFALDQAKLMVDALGTHAVVLDSKGGITHSNGKHPEMMVIT